MWCATTVLAYVVHYSVMLCVLQCVCVSTLQCVVWCATVCCGGAHGVFINGALQCIVWCATVMLLIVHFSVLWCYSVLWCAVCCMYYSVLCGALQLMCGRDLRFGVLCGAQCVGTLQWR
jgi:hypothetical protein